MSDFDNVADDVVDDNAGNRIEGATAKDALEHIVKAIVDDPEAVVIEMTDSRGGLAFSVHVAPEDKGKIIGRRGRVATAVRTVVRAVGSREDINVSVDIADD